MFAAYGAEIEFVEMISCRSATVLVVYLVVIAHVYERGLIYGKSAEVFIVFFQFFQKCAERAGV